MLTGENVLNFFPAGNGGLPISGKYLMAVQAFPLGARCCHGRALAVHSVDDPELTYAFASRFLADNRKLLLLAEKSDEKYADVKFPKTLVIHVLQEIENERGDRGEESIVPSVTVYHLTNSGQGPDIDVFHLPSEIVGFLRAASRATTAQVWRRIQSVAWEKVSVGDQQKGGKKQRKGRKAANHQTAQESLISGPETSRNYLYEDLFALPGNAAQFVRIYFLRGAYRFACEGDPRRDYHLGKELDLVSWELTRLFLKSPSL